MADDNISLLQALQGSLVAPTNSMAGIGATTIAQSIPALTNPYASTSSNMGVTLGAGLLSGLLAGYARRDAAEQNAAVTPVIGQIMQSSDPAERMALAAGNPRLSPLVQALAFEDYSRKAKREDAINTEIGKFKALNPLQRSQAIDNKLIDAGFDQGMIATENGLIPVDQLGLKTPQELEIDKERASIELKNSLEDQRYGGQIPAKDIMQLEQDYTDKLLTGVQAAEVVNINKATANIAQALKKDNPLAAATAIFEYAKLQDPRGTVREADEMRVSDAGGPLGQLARIHNEIMQKGKLTPDAKKNMAELLPILQNNAFAQYNQIRDSYKEALKGYGGDPDRLQFIRQAEIPAYQEDLIPSPDGKALIKFKD